METGKNSTFFLSKYFSILAAVLLSCSLFRLRHRWASLCSCQICVLAIWWEFMPNGTFPPTLSKEKLYKCLWGAASAPAGQPLGRLTEPSCPTVPQSNSANGADDFRNAINRVSLQVLLIPELLLTFCHALVVSSPDKQGKSPQWSSNAPWHPRPASSRRCPKARPLGIFLKQRT